MPRTNVDYSKSLIYMLKKKDDYDNENIYIGSTTDYTRRKNTHKCSCCNPNDKGYNYKKYQYIRDNGGWDEWVMIKIEDYPCNNKLELEKREDEIMCDIKSKLNERRANRSRKDYYEANKEKIIEQTKEYREVNKEKRKEYDKEYYEVNKEKRAEKLKEKIQCDNCGCEVTRASLTRHQKSKKCLNHSNK